MQLSEYRWSGNPRGMHNTGSYVPLQRERYTRLQLGWVKLVTGGEEFAADCGWMLANNITPVIRIYRPAPGAMPVDQTLREQWGVYASYGVKWFEFYNEPNFANPEWPEDMVPRVDHRNFEEVIKPLCENWLIFAEYIIGTLGGYPAFPALGETVGDNGALQWMDALLGYMRDYQRDRFSAIARSGMWWATHPYALNHFYQEVPGQPAVPRPPEQYNALEPGWHFEYPYDPYTQAFDPGRSVWGGTPSTPYGDPNGITAMGIALNQRLVEWFGIGPLPAFGTEGGIYPLPINEAQRPDPRFPAYDRTAHAEATVAMFNWIASLGPEWLFGMALWKEDEYYNNGLPAVPRLEAVPQIARGGSWPTWNKPFIGPGPVRGQPNFHAVILAPGLEPRWFFETAQSYWNTFRPLVTTLWEFIEFIPNDRSLGVTLIAPPDMVDSMRQAIQEKYPHVLLDVLIASGDLSGVLEVLNARVWGNRRFG
ncbi:MAG: hypothetical protein JNM70_08870 [Anaerolineae bacterium]|nr:hypothetical protein [Anaerolineae bacterium]